MDAELPLPIALNDDRPTRVAIIIAVAMVHAALLYLLLQSAVARVVQPYAAITTFNVPVPVTVADDKPAAAGAAAKPAAPRRTVRPEPVLPPVEARPDAAGVATALAQDMPAATDTGAAGPGSGGTADGSAGGGSGGSGGSGTGSGRSRWLRGSIGNADYPRAVNAAGKGGSVTVNFDVASDGMVHNCRVVRSSGIAELDATTCRLIEARFRYTPARDVHGNAVADVAGWRQDWWLEPRR